MKIVHSKYHKARPTVPIRGGYVCQFENSRAVLPDEVADTLVGMGGGFYTILAHDLSEMTDKAKILIIRDGGIGDLLLLTPMIRRLALDKGAVVDVMALEQHRCLFDNNPHVRQTFSLKDDQSGKERIDRTGYDVVLDLNLFVENAERMGSRKHRADAFAEFADIRLYSQEDRHLDYFVTSAERETAKTILKHTRSFCSPKAVIAYVWRSSTANRNWSRQQHQVMLEALAAAGYVSVILDHERQEMPELSIEAQCSTLNLSGNWNQGSSDPATRLTLRGSIAVMSLCDAVITPDTGMFHAAGAKDIPTVTYFGSFPVEMRHTHKQLRVVNNPSVCGLAACHSYQCLNRDENGQSRCLATDPANVLDRLESLLNVDSILERSSSDSDEEASDDHGIGSGGRPGELGDNTRPIDPVQHPAPEREAGKPARRRRGTGNARNVLPTETG